MSGFKGLLLLGLTLVAAAPAAAASPDPVRAPFEARALAEPEAAPAKPAVAAVAKPGAIEPDPGAKVTEGAETEETKADSRERDPAEAVGLASTDAPERYRVGPGDLLRVTVWQEPDASGDFKVSPQGTIQHFFLGEVGVGGHTPAEIAQVMRQALAIDYLRDPRVDVRVEEYHAQKVFVYGQVARPGAYELRGETNVLKLLLDAGGPTRDANGTATLLRVRRGPKGEEVEHRAIALDRLLGSGDLSQNAPVANGDVIFVAGGKDGGTQAGVLDERAYYVLGEVKNPGSYRFKEGVTAMTAILEAGGFNEFARPNKTKLVRGEKGSEQTRILKMGDVLEDGDRREDAKLQAGDVLVVPKSLF